MFDAAEVAVTFYKVLKKNADRYEESVIDKSSDLRKSIIEKTKEDIRAIYEGISEQNIKDAINFLGARISI